MRQPACPGLMQFMNLSGVKTPVRDRETVIFTTAEVPIVPCFPELHRRKKMRNMKKWLSVICASVMALSAAAVTAAEDAEEKELRYGMGYDASTLSIAMCTDDASYTPVKLMTEGLLREVNGEAQPGLAESWEKSDDGKEWTFHLRESSFSDGTPVTANDICYSVIYQLTPENACENAAAFIDITGGNAYLSGEGAAEDVGIEAVDEYTLKISYDVPKYEIMFTGYSYAPLKQELVESAGESYGSEMEYFLGNGPFMLEDWTHDAEIVMVKNPNYWNADAVKLDRIVQIAGATGDTGVDMMATGTLDAALYNSALYRDSAMENPGFTSMEHYSGLQFCHLNNEGKTEETGKWLSNANFRKALSAALDRSALVAAIYTTDVPASKIIPDTELGINGLFNEEHEYPGLNVTQDVDAAKEYLAAAMEELGAADVSEIPTFTMLAFDSENNVKCLNAIADMWSKALGISCDLDMEPIMEMINKALSKDYDFWKGGNSIDVDALNIFLLYDSEYGEGSAVNYVNDQEYHELYLTALNAPTWEERKDAIAPLAEYWTENMMDLVITWQGNYLVYDEKFTGIGINTSDFDYTFADIAE